MGDPRHGMLGEIMTGLSTKLPLGRCAPGRCWFGNVMGTAVGIAAGGGREDGGRGRWERKGCSFSQPNISIPKSQ